jgi:hypothetical protein
MVVARCLLLVAGITLDTACYTRSVKVHYPWHPMYDQEVEISRRQQFRSETYYLISLFDNSQVLMPAWMADEHLCRQFTRGDKPVASLNALRALTALLKTVAP